jgi:hypothetical protein
MKCQLLRPMSSSKAVLDHIAQGETLNPIMLRQKCLNVWEVLRRSHTPFLFPLGDVSKVRNIFDGNLGLPMGSKCSFLGIFMPKHM